MTNIKLDVLVVGAGPTGLACAALLAREGVTVAAITRYPTLANSPRAHIINQRTVEVFRDLGIEDRIRAAAMPDGLMGQVVWAESFAGREIARRRGWGAGAARASDYLAASPCGLVNIHQHLMEPIMAAAASEFGAEVIYNLELVSMRQSADGVVSTCRDRTSGEEVIVTSRYAIGADGDSSAVVREIGLEVEGRMGLGHMVNYWIRADLARYTAHRPGALYQIFAPGGDFEVDNAVFVNVRPWDEWVMSLPYDPSAGDPDRSPEQATRLLHRYTGDDTIDVELISASLWTINQVYAPVMNAGRVLIAGNAAHRHPPAGGLGANTCIQDAFNLCWKLALVLDGTAGHPLLDTYTAERAPVARQIVERANTSLGALLAIPRALGLRPGQPAEEGAAALAERFAATPEGAEKRRALADAVELQDYNFNALGVELGQCYASSAVVSDGSTVPATKDPELFYEPTSAPGSTIPHAWLVRDGREISTLDVVGRGRFTLLIGIDGDAWRAATKQVAADLGIALDVVAVGPGGDAEDPYGGWATLRGVGEDGCVLVRPDRHVAFRSAGRADDSDEKLREAAAAILSHPAPVTA